VEKIARQRGLVGTELDQISIIGAELSDLKAVPAFRLPKGLDTQFGIPGFLKGLLRNQLSPLPEADPMLCTLCGICRDACPPGAISISKNALKVASGRCIRCWCCRELCPNDALKVRQSMLLKLSSKL
jgi:ferredoxin